MLFKGAWNRKENLADHLCFWIIWLDPKNVTWSQYTMRRVLHDHMERIEIHTYSSWFSFSHEATRIENCPANAEHKPWHYHQLYIWIWYTLMQRNPRRSESTQPPWLQEDGRTTQQKQRRLENLAETRRDFDIQKRTFVEIHWIHRPQAKNTRSAGRAGFENDKQDARTWRTESCKPSSSSCSSSRIYSKRAVLQWTFGTKRRMPRPEDAFNCPESRPHMDKELKTKPFQHNPIQSHLTRWSTQCNPIKIFKSPDTHEADFHWIHFRVLSLSWR